MEKQLTLRLAIAVLAVLNVPACAQENPIPPPAPPLPLVVEEHLGNFGALHPECIAWSNACALCTRTPEGKAICSTPGIACTPVETACTETKPR